MDSQPDYSVVFILPESGVGELVEPMVWFYQQSTLLSQGKVNQFIAVGFGYLLQYEKLILLVWPTSWTPAVGGLFVCECVCVSLCVRGHVAIVLGA